MKGVEPVKTTVLKHICLVLKVHVGGWDTAQSTMSVWPILLSSEDAQDKDSLNQGENQLTLVDLEIGN